MASGQNPLPIPTTDARLRNAIPVMTPGTTSGASNIALNIVWPGKSWRTTANAVGSATSTAAGVTTAAMPRLDQSAEPNRLLPKKLRNQRNVGGFGGSVTYAP